MRTTSLIRELRNHARYAALQFALLALGVATTATGYASDGQFDPSFASGGREIFLVDGQTVSSVKTVETPEGKLLMGAFCYGDDGPCIVRLLPDGSFDPSYGTLGLGYARLMTFANPPNNGDFPGDMALLPDGRAVLVSTDSSGVNTSVYVVRADGTNLDQSVGAGKGSLHFIFGNVSRGDGALRVRLQSDGKIIVMCSLVLATGGEAIAVARIQSDLSGLDPSFGSNGIAQVALDVSPSGQNVDFSEALALQSDGKILVGGYGVDGTTFNSVLAVARLLSNGQRDPAFGPAGDGRYHIPFNTVGTQIADLAVDSSGRIVFGGEYTDGTDSTFLMLGRLTQNGLLDMTFSGGLATFNPSTNSQSVQSIVATGDSVLTASYEPRNDGSYFDDYFVVHRFDLNGNPVSSFGLTGSAYSSFGATTLSDHPASLVLTHRGLVVAGYSVDSAHQSEIGVARLQYEHVFQSSFE